MELLIVASLVVPAVVWLVRAAGRRRARQRAVWVQTTARVADVSTFDVEDRQGNHEGTMNRFVVLFELAGGEQHAADWTGRLSQYQKDILLPDAVVPIRYDANDPDRFEVAWEVVRAEERRAAPPAAPRGPERPRPVYAPPRR